jgi:hypothetical protein
LLTPLHTQLTISLLLAAALALMIAAVVVARVGF